MAEPGRFEPITRDRYLYGEPVLQSIVAGVGTQDSGINFNGGAGTRGQRRNVEFSNFFRDVCAVGTGPMSKNGDGQAIVWIASDVAGKPLPRAAMLQDRVSGVGLADSPSETVRGSLAVG